MKYTAGNLVVKVYRLQKRREACPVKHNRTLSWSEWTCQHWYVKMLMDVRTQTFISIFIPQAIWLVFTDRMKC